MSLGLRSKIQIHRLPRDMKGYRAPKPPYWWRIAWVLELCGALAIGWAFAVLVLSLQ